MTMTAPPIEEAAPFVEMLKSYQSAGTVPFSCPGHKRGRGAGDEVRALLGAGVFDCDVWFNTGEHNRRLLIAESLAARVWGADRSFFLVNGSSSGNVAYMMAALRPGDEVVVGRDLHKSLLVALILTGAVPVYVVPRTHSELGIGTGIHPADLAATLDAHPAAKLVALVSPSYYGVSSDLPLLVTMARDRKIPVYVDEAWGPHFAFHPDLPTSAMAAGADGAVTSTHKVLSSLSQSSLLNVKAGLIDPERVSTTVRMTQSTSPLLPLLVSLDACRRQMSLHGERLVRRAVWLAHRARRGLRSLPGLTLVEPGLLGLDSRRYDPLKVVVDVTGLGMSGAYAECFLRERFNIAAEGSDGLRVVCMITAGDTRASVDHLVGAFATLCAENRVVPGVRPTGQMPQLLPAPVQSLSPREAFFAPTRRLRLTQARGEIAAELVVPYPPGIPVLTPGEVIAPETIEYLVECRAAGAHICGPADSSLETVSVVATDA